jgi:hypothetical protein
VDLLGGWTVVGELPAFGRAEEWRRCTNHGRADGGLRNTAEQAFALSGLQMQVTVFTWPLPEGIDAHDPAATKEPFGEVT